MADQTVPAGLSSCLSWSGRARRSAALLLLLAAGCLALLALALAAVVQAGDPLPALALEDQFGAHRTLRPETRLVLFAPDREASRLVDAALDGHDAPFLAAHGIVYVADISGMPELITRLLALPRLRERRYPILLGQAPRDTAPLPRRPAAVSVLRLGHGKVEAIDYVTSAHALAAMLPR